MKDLIQARFKDNLDCVRRIVALYGLLAGGVGRRLVSHTDLLRSGVVLLHASLEDLLRDLAEWKWPSASPSTFADLPLAGLSPGKRYTLEDLAAFRGRTADEVIRESIQSVLGRSTYNNPGEVKALFGKIGIDPAIVDPHAAELAAMMTRRHLIVHRLDRNGSSGQGQHPARSISRATVDDRVEIIHQLGDTAFQQC